MARTLEERNSWEATLQEAEDVRITVEAIYEESMRRSSAPPEPKLPLPPKSGSPAAPAAPPA